MTAGSMRSRCAIAVWAGTRWGQAWRTFTAIQTTVRSVGVKAVPSITSRCSVR